MKKNCDRKSGRGGRALLTGLIRCGRCGRMVPVNYGTMKGNAHRYQCRGNEEGVGVGVFMDTISLSFYGEGGETLGEHGYSKDFRPDLKQMVLGLVVDSKGRPICTEMWPGNTADVKVLLPVIDRLRQRLAIGRICMVADRGMISAETIQGLEERQLDYVLGARERTDTLVSTVVLNDSALLHTASYRAGERTDAALRQEVKIDGKRYIVCRNETEAEKDRKDREAIVAALQDQLKRGDKALVVNSGYRRYLRKNKEAEGKQVFEIDAGKLADEAQFDGIFVLRTNAKIMPLQAVLRYRDLLQVEDLFRRGKAVERAIAGKPPGQRKAVRMAKAKPKLDALAGWFDEQLKLISGKSDLAEAIRYARSRWTALTCYCADGRLEISNNAAENAIRPLALGRKNWLFAGSDAGGERAAVFYTLTRSAKMNGIEPEAYLREVLTRIGEHPVNAIDALLPWNIFGPATLSVAAGAAPCQAVKAASDTSSLPKSMSS